MSVDAKTQSMGGRPIPIVLDCLPGVTFTCRRAPFGIALKWVSRDDADDDPVANFEQAAELIEACVVEPKYTRDEIDQIDLEVWMELADKVADECIPASMKEKAANASRKSGVPKKRGGE